MAPGATTAAVSGDLVHVARGNTVTAVPVGAVTLTVTRKPADGSDAKVTTVTVGGKN